MNKKTNALLLFLLGSTLVGCSVEGKNDYGSYYQQQESLSVLKMPSGVTEQGADNFYVVPPGPTADVKTVSILPPGSRAYKLAMAKNEANGVAANPAPAVVATPVVASAAPTAMVSHSAVANNTTEPAKQ